MLKSLTLAALALTVLVACGSAGASNGSSSSGTTQGISEAQALAVADQTFPKAEQYGYYVVCGLDGNTAACPYSERLKARLAALKDTLMRAQTPSSDRKLSVTVLGDAAIVRAELFGGRAMYDLTIVRASDGRLLVDDESCAGQGSTSIYAERLVACNLG